MRPRRVLLRSSLALAAVAAPFALGVTVTASSPPPRAAPGIPDLATLEALDEAPAECPFDLVGALEAAGVEAHGDVEAEVQHGRELPPLSSLPVDELTGLDLAGGVIVDCSVDVDGTEVEVLLHASPNEHASGGSFLPTIMINGRLDPAQGQAVFNRLYFATPGELVDISDLAAGPVALAKPVVEGAADAVLVVSADLGVDDGGTLPESPAIDVEAVASALIGGSPVAMTEDEFVEAAQDRDLTEEQARCVYGELDGNVDELLTADALDLSGDELQRLTTARSVCTDVTATTSP